MSMSWSSCSFNCQTPFGPIHFKMRGTIPSVVGSIDFAPGAPITGPDGDKVAAGTMTVYG